MAYAQQPPWWDKGATPKDNLRLILEEAQRIGYVMRIISLRVNNMGTIVEELVAQVAATKGVQESAVAAIVGLHTALDAAIATGDMEAVKAAVVDLKANTEGLAAAVAASPVPPAPGPSDPVVPAPAP